MFIWSVLNGWIIAPTMRVRSLGSGRALDFIGMNYYMVEHVRHAKAEGLWRLFGEPCYESHHPWEWSNSLGWKVYPRGLYDLLKDFARYRVPIIITENGICAKDDGERAKFIEEHLRWVFQAKKEGVPVSGYLYWSLLDNFEWADGYGPRFGLVEVDYATQRRTVRPSARIMAERMSAHISSCNRERNSVTR
jgi:beta-glucosidase